MHQTSCGNGFPILAKEVDIICKPLVLAEQELMSLAALGHMVDSLFLCMYISTPSIEDAEFGMKGGDFSNQRVLLLPVGRLQPELCW